MYSHEDRYATASLHTHFEKLRSCGMQKTAAAGTSKGTAALNVLKLLGRGLGIGASGAMKYAPGVTVTAGTMGTMYALNKTAPDTVSSVAHDIMKPTITGISKAVTSSIDEPNKALQKAIADNIKLLSQSSPQLAGSISESLKPVRGFVKDISEGAGKAFTTHALPGIGAMGGAGVGAIIGDAISRLAAGKKESPEALSRRKNMSWVSAGAGGIGGYFLTKYLQDKGYV